MILVTGGAGYIGSHTVKALRASGFDPLIFDDFSTGHRDFVGKTELVEGDLVKPESIERAFRDYPVEGVLHFAGKALIAESFRRPETYYATNVTGGINLLTAMKNAGVKRIIFSSSCTTYGVSAKSPIDEDTPQRPINPYGETKLAFEHELRSFREAYGMEYLALRYFNAAGAGADGDCGEDHNPETHLIPLVLDAALGRKPEVKIFGTDYPTPDGTCVRDYIHVTDLANAHVAGLKRLMEGSVESQGINLGTGTGYSVREVVETVRRVTKAEFKVVEAPRREGDPPVLVAAVGRAHATLGWKAEFGLEQIVTSAWTWHRKRFGRG